MKPKMVKSSGPLMLSGSVTLSGPGVTAIAPTNQLTSPFREAMWIDHIVWQATGSTQFFWNWGGAVRTRLMLGRTELTRNRNNGFVPIWNMGFQVNDFFTETTRDNITTADNITGAFYRWKLPRPLYVPPGMGLVSEFQYVTTGIVNPVFAVPVTVNVAYAGRYVDPNEPTRHEIDVPFVSFFEAPSTASAWLSDAMDLVNPFEVPLQAQRFMGRAQEIQTSGPIPVALTESNTGMLGSTVKIQDSHGHNIVRDFVPGSSQLVFDYLRRGWTFNQVVPPKQWYAVQLQATPGPTFGAFQHVSLIGWRKEQF